MTTTPIGIDLGTTYSAVSAVDEKGEVQLLANAEGKYLTPSVIFFEDDNIVVGDVAKEARADMPDVTVEFIKRSMGTDRHFSFIYQEFSPIELSAFILKKLKKDAEAALGQPITQAVITCPAYFGAERRDATEKAAQIAGVDVLALVNEPTAAAMAFGMGGDRTGTALVFDLGGGTFDVTIVKFGEENHIEVLASDGDAELGGKDFDDEIIQMVVAEFMEIHGTDISSAIDTIAELRKKAEKAKHDLSARESTKISLNVNGQKLRMDLTREAFSTRIQPLLEGIKFTLSGVLDECNLTKDEITEIILVGGSTRVHAVRKLVHDFFGREPNTTVHPDEAVARGAALYATKVLANRDEGELTSELNERAKEFPTVQDIAPHSIGVTILHDENTNHDINSIILPRGAHLPTSSTKQYGTVHDGQRAAKIDVNEGEDEDLEYVNELGSFTLNFPSARAAGSPVDVQVNLDLSGIIRVQATDLISKKQEEIFIDYAVNLSQEEVRERKSWLERQTVL